MSDFLSEVDKELRNDRMQAMWKKFSPLVFGGAFLIIAGTAGYKAWTYWNEQQAAASGSIMIEALADIEAGSVDEAQAKLDELSQSGYGKYPILAKIVQADALLAKGDLQAAADAFKALNVDASTPVSLKDFLAIRAAMITVDLKSYDKFQVDVNSIAEGATQWRHLARELLALSAWKAKNLEEAARWTSAMKADADMPQNISDRAAILESLILSAGGTLSKANE